MPNYKSERAGGMIRLPEKKGWNHEENQKI